MLFKPNCKEVHAAIAKYAQRTATLKVDPLRPLRKTLRPLREIKVD